METLLNIIATFVPIDNFTQKMLTILNMGIDGFDTLQWSEVQLVSNEDALAECEILYRVGLADRYLRRGRFVYMFKFENSSELSEMMQNEQVNLMDDLDNPKVLAFWSLLSKMEASTSDTLRRGAAFIRELIAEGTTEITRNDWMSRTGMSGEEFDCCKAKCFDLGIAVNVACRKGVNTRKPTILRFSIADYISAEDHISADSVTRSEQASNLSVQTHPADQLNWDLSTDSFPSGGVPGDPFEGSVIQSDMDLVIPSEIQWNPPREACTVQQILDKLDGGQDRDQRIHDFLYTFIGKPDCSFTSHDWIKHFEPVEVRPDKDIRKAFNLGIITRKEGYGPYKLHIYTLRTGLIPPINTDLLSVFRQNQLSSIYERFGTSSFTLDQFADILGIKQSSAAYTLEECVQRGLIAQGHYKLVCYYRLTVNPTDNPECFQFDESSIGTNIDSNLTREDILVMA